MHQRVSAVDDVSSDNQSYLAARERPVLPRDWQRFPLLECTKRQEELFAPWRPEPLSVL